MSSDADTTGAAIVALFRSLSTEAYCDMAAATLYIYEAFVTFDREVACFWNSKRTGASLLYFANKWITMMLFITGLVSFAYFPSDKFIPGSAFSALRAYGLTRSKLLGLVILVMSLAPLAANLVLYKYHYSGVNVPPFGCLATVDASKAVDLRLVIVARVPLIIADVLLIYITWSKLSSWAALMDLRRPKRITLSDVLFRGGTIYFVVLSLLNVLHLTLSVTAVATAGEGSVVTTFTAPITAILISRFLLELQETSQMVVRLDPDDPLHSLRDPDDVPGFISPLGGFIEPDLPVPFDDNSESQSHASSRSGTEEEGGAHASEAAASSPCA